MLQLHTNSSDLRPPTGIQRQGRVSHARLRNRAGVATPPRTASLRQTPSKPDISHIEVIPEYDAVLKSIRDGTPATFVTGRAGTGKSTLIEYLQHKLSRCAVVAPTAIAAMNVRGTTIHSFFGIPPRTLNPNEAFDPRQTMLPVIRNLEALIVDEVSMVVPDLVDCISNSLIKARRINAPFGGVPVVYIGDMLQLPPVIDDKEVGIYYSERYSSKYFFSADVFNRIDIVPVQLTTAFRQKDQDFLKILDQIRTNRFTPETISFINNRCVRNKADGEDNLLTLVPTNAAAESINSKRLKRIQERVFTYKAVVEGYFDTKKRALPAPELLQLKQGARVIFRKNNHPEWLNGTLGEVVQLDNKTVQVRLLDSGNTVSVAPETWQKIRYQYNREQQRIDSEIVGSFRQLPLSLGWAITVHKSQGMTLDSVRIDLGKGAFCSGQTYVALSRCRTFDGISLEKPLTSADVKVDPEALRFYENLGLS